MEFDISTELEEMARRRAEEHERRRIEKAEERAEFKRRRDYGLAQRHGRKLARDRMASDSAA